MFSLRPFFYDVDPNGGNPGGGEPPATPELFLSAEEAKEFGITSKDALRELINKSKIVNPTDQEREQMANREKAAMIKYAADNNLMKLDDINRLDALKQKNKRDRVFDSFSSE